MATASIDPQFCADAFSLTPDPRRFFLSRGHAEALAGLRLGLEYRRGLIVVVGEVGMGKTTVAYSLLSTLGPDARTAYIANTRMPFDGILRLALEDFGVAPGERDRAGLLALLNGFLLECARAGRTAVLVVDEAQSLDDETFENLRLLSNVETYEQKLLQIVLLGQPELDARLRQPQLRQIADRVGVRVNINPLGRPESRGYIEHRLQRAGGSLAMFTDAALEWIVWRARGVPRRMNVLCHNALLLAYAAGASQVTWRMAREAGRDLRGGRVVRLWRFRPQWSEMAWRGGAGFAIAAGAFAAVTAMVQPGAAPSTPAVAATPPPCVTTSHVDAVPPDEPLGPTGPAADTVAAEAPAVEPEPIAVAAVAPPTPAVVPPARVAAAPATDGGSQEHLTEITIQRGASLYAIAHRYYGSSAPSVVRRIAEANPGLRNPHFIVAGERLLLPGHPAVGAAQPTEKGS